MTLGLRPYRWFGRDAPDDWDRVPAVRCGAGPVGAAPGPPPRTAESSAWWAWLGAFDRAQPGHRSALWDRQGLNELRTSLERALGQSLPWDAFLTLWRTDLSVLSRTPPGQRPEGPSWLSRAVAVLASADRSGWVALRSELASMPPATPAQWNAGQGGIGWVADGELLVSTRLGGWAPVARPLEYYGELGIGLPGSPAEVVEALGVALGRGTSLQAVLVGLIARLPGDPGWRTDFWLLLLEELDPRTLVLALTPDDACLEILWRSVAGTPVAGPLLATAGEALLGLGGVTAAEALAWAAAGDWTGTQRAVACCLQARALSDEATVQLWIDARDPRTGLLVPTRAAAAVSLLRDALLSSDPEDVASLVLQLHTVGGPEGVAAVLDGLMAEGASTPLELRAAFRQMGERRSGVALAVAGTVYAGWMGVTDAGGRW